MLFFLFTAILYSSNIQPHLQEAQNARMAYEEESRKAIIDQSKLEFDQLAGKMQEQNRAILKKAIPLTSDVIVQYQHQRFPEVRRIPLRDLTNDRISDPFELVFPEIFKRMIRKNGWYHLDAINDRYVLTDVFIPAKPYLHDNMDGTFSLVIQTEFPQRKVRATEEERGRLFSAFEIQR